MLSLDDLDTAFPRTTSNRFRVSFDDDTHRLVTTNSSYDEFTSLFLDKDICMAYYPKGNDHRVARVTKITKQR
jgi:hypothetical protein